MVPGAGPAIDGSGWKVAKHPRHRRRQTPYLTDVIELGRVFRKHYLCGLRRLLSQGKLKIGGSVSFLQDLEARQQWLQELESIDWNVFSQGPPAGKSNPAQVVKYLAGYLTGGPIHDRRLIRADEDEVWFWARPKRSGKRYQGMNRPEPYRLSSGQFLQRWTLHILPKGFTRSRCYGGYHGSKRKEYLARCRELLGPDALDIDPDAQRQPDEAHDSPPESKCPHCDSDLILVRSEGRPSWREIFKPESISFHLSRPQPRRGSGRSPPLKSGLR